MKSGKNIIKHLNNLVSIDTSSRLPSQIPVRVEQVLRRKMNLKFNPKAPPSSIIVNPVGFICNMACDYCYFKNNHFGKFWQYDDITFLHKKLVEFYRYQMPRYKKKYIAIIWFGGEPLMQGIKFYKNIMEVQENIEKNNSDVRFYNAIQSNGTLINRKWASFFHSNRLKWGINISYDGLPFLHDKHRKYKNGSASSSDILNNMKLLKSQGVRFYVIIVVTEDHLPHTEAIFGHLVDELGVKEFGLNAISDICARKGIISAESYGKFLVSLFRKWVKRDEPFIHIREIEAIIMKLLGFQSGVCRFADNACGNFPVIANDFKLSFCDEYGRLPEFDIGSFRKNNINFLVKNIEMLRVKIYKKRAVCLDNRCRYFPICSRGCPLFWNKESNIFCEGYKMLFGEIENFLKGSFAK